MDIEIAEGVTSSCCVEQQSVSEWWNLQDLGFPICPSTKLLHHCFHFIVYVLVQCNGSRAVCADRFGSTIVAMMQNANDVSQSVLVLFHPLKHLNHRIFDVGNVESEFPSLVFQLGGIKFDIAPRRFEDLALLLERKVLP